MEKLVETITPQMAELIGAFIGDGNLSLAGRTRSTLSLSFYGDATLDRDYFENILSKTISSLFAITPKLYFRSDSNAIILNTYSKSVGLAMQSFGFKPGSKTYDVQIPNEIIRTKNEIIFATIRGIFDTDGNFFVDRRKIYKKEYPRITLRTVSRPLFEQLKTILENHFSLYCQEQKTPTGPSYHIVVYGNAQVEKWMQLIGSSNQRHLTKIREFQSRRRESNPQPMVYKTMAPPLSYVGKLQ